MMGPQMVAHIFILVLIIIGNFTYFMTRNKGASGAKS